MGWAGQLACASVLNPMQVRIWLGGQFRIRLYVYLTLSNAPATPKGLFGSVLTNTHEPVKETVSI